MQKSPSKNADSVHILQQQNSEILANYEALKIENNSLKAANAELKQWNDWFREQLKLSKKHRFGSSSEKSAGQLNMFHDECEEQTTVVPEVTEVKSHKRSKSKSVVDSLPDDMPVEVVEHMLPEDTQQCPQCDGPLHVIGKTLIRKELKLIPAKATIVEHYQLAYACRNCEKNDVNVPIVKSPVSNAVIKGGNASPEAIAHIIAEKFVMYSPLYRQEQYWKQKGIYLSRQTMDNWIIKATEDYIEPIYLRMKELLLDRNVLHGDETFIQVLREPGKKPQSKSFMFVYRTGGDAENSIIIMEYQPSRGQEHIAAFFEGYAGGYLHVDGYSGYNVLPETVTRVGCWAHSRRRWQMALDVLPEKDREESLAFKGWSYCNELFAIERQLKELTEYDRKEQRKQQAQPVLNEFRAWLKSLNPGKNTLGKAINYTLGQWKHLESYLLNGNLEISNLRCERSIRPFAVNRKNFLFCNTPRGARTAAMVYSIVETARENGVDIFDYLTYLFRNMPNDVERSIDNYLPWNFKPDGDRHEA